MVETEIKSKKPRKVRSRVVAKQSFGTADTKSARGRVYSPNPDDAVWDDDPDVKRHPELFEPIEEALARMRGEVYVATAAPGETR